MQVPPASCGGRHKLIITGYCFKLLRAAFLAALLLRPLRLHCLPAVMPASAWHMHTGGLTGWHPPCCQCSPAGSRQPIEHMSSTLSAFATAVKYCSCNCLSMPRRQPASLKAKSSAYGAWKPSTTPHCHSVFPLTITQGPIQHGKPAPSCRHTCLVYDPARKKFGTGVV